jgi:hypothetical protein
MPLTWGFAGSFFISLSAYKGTRQLYGQAKLACERTASSLGGVSTRLGLVYGPGWGGMAGALRKLTNLPVTPLIGARSHQFTVHEAEMAAAMVRIAESDMLLPEPVGLANPEPVPFRWLMEEIAASQGRTLRAVLMPWQPVGGFLKGAEALHVPLSFRSDSILVLVRPLAEVPGSVFPINWSNERFRQYGIYKRDQLDGSFQMIEPTVGRWADRDIRSLWHQSLSCRLLRRGWTAMPTTKARPYPRLAR